MEYVQPQSIDSERAVLGAMLMDEDASLLAISELSEESFYLIQHQIVFHAMKVLISSGKPVDMLTVTELLAKKGKIDQAGGAGYFTSFVNRVPSSANISHYIKIVKEKAMERRILSDTYAIQESIFNGESGERDNHLLDSAITSLVEARSSCEKGRLKRPDMVKAVDRIETMSVDPDSLGIVKTGISAIDNKSRGYRPKELIIIAGRPGMGKTALMLTMARNICKFGKTVGIFSLEMSEEELSYRMLSSESGVPYIPLTDGIVGPQEYDLINSASARLSEYNLFVDDTPGITAVDILSKIRLLSRTQKPDIVFVDYLQIMRHTGKYDSRNDEVSKISASLREVAKSLSIPVVAFAQLSRNPENRQNRRPGLADLRDSGAIEQDADMVHFLFREGYYGTVDDMKKTEIITAKNRRGPTGTEYASFMYEHMKFVDYEYRRDLHDMTAEGYPGEGGY